MVFYKKIYNRLRKAMFESRGSAQLLAVASAIAATMSIYFFVSLTTMDRQQKERVAHLYNAYQMGISIDALIQLRMTTKGETNTSLQDKNGNDRFTKKEFQKYSQIEADTIYTLQNLLDDVLIVDSYDPTATRLLGENTYYDRDNTKIKVILDMGIDSYDENGDIVKKLVGVKYLVNLAGNDASTYENMTNAPYDAGMPFYYLVGFSDDAAGLNESDITLKTLDGVKFEGVLDIATNGIGPQAKSVIILPTE
ncbi:MAG: hypothetical protein ACO3K7_03260 [Candidatus Marinamargulisbacteria bacterium]